MITDAASGLQWPDVPKRGDVIRMKPDGIRVVVLAEYRWPSASGPGCLMTVFWLGKDGAPFQCDLPLEAFDLHPLKMMPANTPPTKNR